MRILIITDSYPPEVRSAALLMKELALGLKEKGHTVYVVTSFPKYNLVSSPNINFPKIVNEDGIVVLRVKAFFHHKTFYMFRGIAQMVMPYTFFSACKKAIKEKIDDVIVHSPPLPLNIAAIKLKKRYGAKFIMSLQDIFPQNAVDLNILRNTFLIWFFKKMERYVYKNADLIVVPSFEHKKYIERKNKVPSSKITVVYHWIDSKPFLRAQKTSRFRRRYGISEDKLIFLFAGTMGPSQGLELILNIAARVKEYRDIVFLFVGDGSAKENLVKTAKEKKLENVVFQPFVSLEEYPELVKDCDVGISCSSAKNTTPLVQAKIPGYLAAGIPVAAFLADKNEGAKMIEKAGCGLIAEHSDEEKATEVVLKLYQERDWLKDYGKNGLDYFLKNLERRIAVEKFEKLL